MNCRYKTTEDEHGKMCYKVMIEEEFCDWLLEFEFEDDAKLAIEILNKAKVISYSTSWKIK